MTAPATTTAPGSAPEAAPVPKALYVYGITPAGVRTPPLRGRRRRPGTAADGVRAVRRGVGRAPATAAPAP